ncbi:cytochrome P450 [Sandaracinobacteroides saxicola]|uniref:Cytochrome P450 n=1 Tax=Sandaracinobacteroides saxicola TaxID=2759707 RepID=A0A7G5IEF8_9SPHN|nr:cytochrome P450 [Sandaracinobacteroides saxicola]QMW21750.1 cytochrome P450 [Sandaracinobacteroides saxicola]
MSGFFARLGGALAGLGGLIAKILGADGGLKARLKAVLGSTAGQRDVFAILRLVKPALALKKNLIAPYPATGSLILTRAGAVDECLAREADFSVVYEPRMRKITGGPNFFLGMQDGPEYRRDTGAMRAIVGADDIADLVLPMVRTEAATAIHNATTANAARIDLPPALTARVPALMVQRYFGLHTASVADLIPWATAMFYYLFSDLSVDKWVEDSALTAAAETRDALDAAVAAPAPDTLIARAVAARSKGETAFQGDGIRNNMIGIVIGAIPTLSKAACHTLDELFRQPAALASAAEAARRGDERLVAAHVFEALRFNPINPVIYRRAVADTRIAGTSVARDTMLLAANLSSMHDESVVPDPRAFRTDRPWSSYLLWGRGTHLCFGDRINAALLPAMLLPLLALPNLRRAPGAAGRIDGTYEGHDTPFPRHFVLEWDA